MVDRGVCHVRLHLTKNNISLHYRILDDKYYRIYSSLDEQEAVNRFQELISTDKQGRSL